jgi:hypothetical protein
VNVVVAEPDVARSSQVRAAWIRVCVVAFVWLVAIGVGSLALSLDVSRQRVTIAWAASVSDVQREQLEQSLGLMSPDRGGDGSWNYLLRDRSLTASNGLSPVYGSLTHGTSIGQRTRSSSTALIRPRGCSLSR